MLHESNYDDQLILIDIIFHDIINHIIHSTKSFHDCENEADIMIRLKHEKQVQISKHDSFIILLKLNYFIRVYMIFCNKFVREKKFILLKFLLDIFKINISMIFIVNLLFESNCIAVTI